MTTIAKRKKMENKIIVLITKICGYSRLNIYFSQNIDN